MYIFFIVKEESEKYVCVVFWDIGGWGVALRYNSVYTVATNWRSEQLLSTEQSRDLIEAFSYSEKFNNIGNDTDSGRATTSFRPGQSPGLKGKCE